MANYEGKYALPSGGALYDQSLSIPAEVSLRSMTTKEEKIIFGSDSEDSVLKVLQECILDKFDANDLLQDDEFFLLIKLRSLSYGSDYHSYGRCPECNNVNEYKINLDDLEVDNYDEKKMDKYFKFTLPRAKDEIEVTLPTMKLSNQVDADIEKRISMAKKSSIILDPQELRYEYTNAYQIKSVNNKELTAAQRLKYYDDMNAMDAAYIRDRYSKIDFGVNTLVEVKCLDCGEKFHTNFSMGPEFFHPRFD